ncbi:hypothetical protein ACH5RR_030719 [Cinchona calisaya]|uniref:Pectinesterase inhibitor domain-containing protein n=1 Tax=Cinchona calisaya TaxID=153742 RepID=A0ABD2YVH4_9GENT
MANYNNSFSLLLLAIVTLFFISQNANGSGQIGVNQFCKTSNNKQLCNRMVNGATNLHDASVNAIKVAIYVANKIKTLTPIVVEAASNLDENLKKQIVDGCVESFSDTIDDLNLSLDLFNKGDMGGVGTRLSAAFDSQCMDSLKEQGVAVPSLLKINDNFAKIVDNTLAVVFQS